MTVRPYDAVVTVVVGFDLVCKGISINVGIAAMAVAQDLVVRFIVVAIAVIVKIFVALETPRLVRFGRNDCAVPSDSR